MAKIAHIVNNGGNINARRPWTMEIAATQKYNGDKYFMDHERSPFFERALDGIDYIELTARAFGQDEMAFVGNWMIRFARQGMRLAGRQWKFLWGSWSDKGSMIMIPSDSKINTLEDIGIQVNDSSKAPKYMKRAKAPHQYAVFGEIINLDYTYVSQGSVIVEFRLDDGYVGTLRHVFLDSLDARQKAIADGQGRIKTDFLRHVGVKARNLSLYACKGTTLDPIGLGKGYYHAQDDLEYDIVVYGPKTQLTYDKFFFGILGSLKPGRWVYTDLQSMTNFDEWQYALGSAQQLFTEIVDNIRDEEKLSAMFMPRVMQARTARLDSSNQFSGWYFINAKMVGMSFHAEPSLIRKAAQHWKDEVVNCGKGRIPADHLMLRADIVPDPHMFNRFGDVQPENTIIPNGHMVCWDVPEGPTVEYRQPNGHPLEHSASENIHLSPLKKYRGYQRCFYGADMLEMNAPKNGADNDDTQVIVFNPEMVKMIRNLNYPLTHKIEIGDVAIRTGRYLEQIKGTAEDLLHFSAVHVEEFVSAVEAARGKSLQLGQVVNQIMLDTLLSGRHKANMMKFLAHKFQTAETDNLKHAILNYREWLANRKDYQLAHVATNLEAVIDFCVQGKGDSQQFSVLQKAVDDVRENTKVYPFTFGKPGTGFLGQGRIPPRKKEGKDFIFAPSLLCDALTAVDEEIDQFDQDMKAAEWEFISEVPEDVEFEFPHSRDIYQTAMGIKVAFDTMTSSAMSNKESAHALAAYREALRGKFHKCNEYCERACKHVGELITPGLQQMMDNLEDDETRMLVAVELKRICQRQRSMLIDQETGRVRGVPDSVFGNDVVFNIYLQALETCGLTGKYVQVDFDVVSERLRDKSFMCVVEQGNVFRKDDNFWIGTVDADNGEYLLKHGLLEVRKPSKEIADPHSYEGADEEGNFPNAIDLHTDL